MREFLQMNKSKIIRAILLLVVFFLIATYINGRNIYKAKMEALKNANTQLQGSIN